MLVLLAACEPNVWLASACSGSVNGDAVRAGDVLFSPTSATAIPGVWERGFILVVTPATDACGEHVAWYASNPPCPERQWMEVLLIGSFAGAGPLGSYPIHTLQEWPFEDDGAVASIWKSPPLLRCDGNLPAVDEQDKAVWGASGSIRVDVYEARQRVAGSYDITFDTGDITAASFDVPFCNTDNQCSSE